MQFLNIFKNHFYQNKQKNLRFQLFCGHISLQSEKRNTIENFIPEFYSLLDTRPRHLYYDGYIDGKQIKFRN